MNRTHIAAALALSFIAAAASAADAIPPTWANEQAKPYVSTVTRAQVQAELMAARQNGEISQFDSLADLQPKAPAAGLSTMLAKVREGAGNVAAATQTKTEGGLTRAQVQAELMAARRNGELNPFDNLAYMNTQKPAAYAAPRAVAAAQ